MMESEIQRSEPIKVRLENGATVYIQHDAVPGEEDVALQVPSFSEVGKTIEGIAESLLTAIKKVRPTGTTVEFGLEIGVESGKLTTMLVKGTSSATLKVTLAWGEFPEIAGS